MHTDDVDFYQSKARNKKKSHLILRTLSFDSNDNDKRNLQLEGERTNDRQVLKHFVQMFRKEAVDRIAHN